MESVQRYEPRDPLIPRAKTVELKLEDEQILDIADAFDSAVETLLPEIVKTIGERMRLLPQEQRRVIQQIQKEKTKLLLLIGNDREKIIPVLDARVEELATKIVPLSPSAK